MLSIQSISKSYKKQQVLQNVSFDAAPGECIGLLGPNGCGKSTLGRVILNLHQRTGGRIIFQGKDISDVTKAQLKELRKDMQIIFQDPYASLNPRMSIGEPMACIRMNWMVDAARG